MHAAPLVSCLCLTNRRVALLRRAVSCFLSQTYRPRELLVLYPSDDSDTSDYLATLGESSIRPVEIHCSSQLSTGSLRNISLQAAQGHYVATWDDDDWYAPTRLAEQISAIGVAGKPGCILSRLILYDGLTKSAFLSEQRTWENSLVAERTAIPPYSDQRKGSDTTVIHRMLIEDKLAILNRPELYIYIYHGGNLWNREHWETNLLRFACPITRNATERMRSFLEAGEV